MKMILCFLKYEWSVDRREKNLVYCENLRTSMQQFALCCVVYNIMINDKTNIFCQGCTRTRLSSIGFLC